MEIKPKSLKQLQNYFLSTEPDITARTMDEKDKHDSKPTKHSKSSRSVFDFSSVEDLRETEGDLVSTDSTEETQPNIPFNKSYIARAPSRHLFTLNSRCTYFGGFGTSIKDMSGSAEDLRGSIGTTKRNLSLSKFSKSSPDLFGASYQSSDSDDVTEQETHEDFVTHIDTETNINKKGIENRNAKSVKCGKGIESVIEPKHEEDTKLRLETKWATKIESQDNVQLSVNTLQRDNKRHHTSFSSEATTLTLQSKTGKKAVLVQYPGAISVSENNGEDKIESFDKGWKNILHSGKAELRKSLENLNSFRQDMNSREIYNVDTFESERLVRDEPIEPRGSIGEEMILKYTSEETMETKDYETGIKRDNEVAGLSMDDLLKNRERQKGSQENMIKVFSQGSSSSCVSNTTDDEQINYSGMTSCKKEMYMTNNVNTDEAATTPRDKTANENEEKQTALSIINSKTDNLDLCTSKEEHAAANEQCFISDVKMFQTQHNNSLDSKAEKMDRNNEWIGSSLTLYNSTVEQKEARDPQATDNRNKSVDKSLLESEQSSKKIVCVPLCNISPIPLTVLSNSYHEDAAWQNTEEFRRQSTNSTMKVSEIRQSSLIVTEGDLITVDFNSQSLLNKTPDNWLNNDPRPDKVSSRTANETEDHTKSQSVENEEQKTPLKNDSPHELNNNLLNNATSSERAKSAHSPNESADNSLMKNMMGMFCLLGLKDTPEGGFYSNGQLQYKEQEKATDISSKENERDCSVDETITKPTRTAVNTPTNISNDYSALNQDEVSFEDPKSLNGIKTESSVNRDYNEGKDVDRETKSGSENNAEKIKIRQKEETFDEYINDVILALEEKNIVDEDILFHTEPDKTLDVADFKKGKQEKPVKHSNTEGYIDEEVLSRTAMTQDLLFQTPGDLLSKKETTVRENYDAHFFENTADVLTTSKHGGLKLSSENKQKQNLKNMITSKLEINRNKWSHLLIIPRCTINSSKKLPGALNILVLNKELIPTSPERNQTVVTINFHAREGEKEHPQGKNDEVSLVDIQINLQESKNEDSNSIEEGVLQFSPVDNIAAVMDQDHLENDPGQLDETKQLQFTHDHVFERIIYNEVVIDNEIQQSIVQTDESTTNKTYLKLDSDNIIQETVEKVDIVGMKDKRLLEHLRSFETDELVDEKITKQEKTEHNNLLTELDGFFLPDNEIQETITKDEIKGVEHEILLEVDELFTLEEEIKDQETVVKSQLCGETVKTFEENNSVILLQEEGVSLSEFSTHEIAEKPKHSDDSSPLRVEVPEVITNTTDDRSLQNEHVFQLDDVLQPKYVNEFVSKKLKVKHDNHDNFLETDQFFHSLKHTEQTITPNYIQTEQSPEFQTSPESPTKNVEKTVAYISIPHQANEYHHIAQTDKDKKDSGLCIMEKNLQDDAWEITLNDQEVPYPEEVVSVSTKETNVSNTKTDELISRNSIHDGNINNTDDMRQWTASPIPGNLSSITSYYDTSTESSSESPQSYIESNEDCQTNHDVPWDVTVTYPNPDPMESECKLLRASYSNIQPEVYNIDSQTADFKVTVDGKNIDGVVTVGKNNGLHIPKQRDAAGQLHTSHSTTGKSNEIIINKRGALNDGTLLGKGNQYRTTMDIHRNQVSTSYVLFQQFGKQECPKTYFELDYDVDKWKVGETNSCHRDDDDQDKTFVVSYATIEQVNYPQVACPVYLPTIEEDKVYGEDVYDVYVSNENQSALALPPPMSPPHTPPQSPTSPLPPPMLPPHTPPQSLTPRLPTPSSQTPELPPPQIPTEYQDTNLHTVHYPNKDSSPENTPYPLLPAETSFTQKIEAGHHLEKTFEEPEEKGQVGKHPLSETAKKEVELVEIHYNLQQELTHEIPYQVPPTPHADVAQRLPVSPETPQDDLSYETLRNTQLPAPVSESRPPVWSFAQSIFHTDGHSKTFFKVIDSRNKSFQSSTFMYRGERIKVSRKVNVFKNHAENWKEDISDDCEGYSEIWDSGNLMQVDNEIMVERDEAVTTLTMAYEMPTEQDYFTEEESRNCSWHLNIREGNGVCQISSGNLDAIAVEDDNTLTGSRGFISGQHKWAIQGLGIFCAVGVCYPGAEVESWYKGSKWLWTTDGLKYSEPTGIGRSEFGQWRNEDVLVITLDCEDQTLRITNTRTNVEATLHGFKGKVYPYFNIYKGSCIRLLETSVG